ncbi:MAG: hypothetical protein GXP45_00700 [bacterium]|nr:hypothetical protein [bacterium]
MTNLGMYKNPNKEHLLFQTIKILLIVILLIVQNYSFASIQIDSVLQSKYQQLKESPGLNKLP